MFDRRAFVKKGLLDAVGKMPDYWVTLNADTYGEKGVLTEEDLAEIQKTIDAKNAQPEEIAPEDEFNGLKGVI